MTAWSDVPNGMHRATLDGDTIERLLSARVAPDDAPPGYSEVARVLRLVAAVGDPPDRAQEERHVGAAIAVIARDVVRTAPTDPPRTSGSLRRRARVAGLVLAGTLVGSSGLAFAGALPDPAQDAFAGVLERVGITVPAGHGAPTPIDHPASTGEEISDIATSTELSGVDKGAAISSIASGGRSRAGQAGGGAAGASGVPPVDTPNGGGTETSNAASGSASQAGTDRADERSNGRSAAGSSNAADATRGSSAGSPAAASKQ